MAEPCPVLPDHVIEDVLARLPAKSVLRCRCLSRTWVAMLSSDDFADRHLRLANRHGGPRILNPAGLAMAALPEGRATGCRRHAAEAHHKYTSLGIGYDMLIKKHKVVCIYYRGSDAEKLP
ncbi:putative F-box protein At5g38810 [Aegilops tauschii subsp. strangulata]|uniref:putative F-box protein At5g38810 n=1 Tax=Aegilops tauschii subsp. strangulata TaxID=200361 RepID=UPI00098B7D78|nr:putative F-box protein At5g38810 [Aegilops tauschii subsp. strangulata]